MAHFGQAPSLLDLIPGARAGVNYLLGAVADFQRLPLRLNAAQTKVIAAKRAAETRGDFGTAAKAAITLQSIGSLQGEQQTVGAQVADMLDQFRTIDPNNVPFSVGLAAARVAAQAAGVLSSVRDVENQASALLSQTGAVVPGTSAAGGASSFGKYLLYGGLIYGAFWALKRSRGTRHW